MAEIKVKAPASKDMPTDKELVADRESLAEKVETTRHRLTWKHAAALFSLTLLWLSAAGPVFFITASIGIFQTLKRI
jgi:hypothetical protein